MTGYDSSAQMLRPIVRVKEVSTWQSEMRLALVCLLILGGAAVEAFAQTKTALYKSTGPDGRTVYSDQPPPQARDAKALTFTTLPASPLSAETLAYVEQLRKSADAHATAVLPVTETILFSATWCGYCRQAKNYLAGKHVAYREVDIDTKEGLAAYARAGGGRGVPVLLANGKSMAGFSAAAYDVLFATAK